jgi:hypothetical protein
MSAIPDTESLSFPSSMISNVIPIEIGEKDKSSPSATTATAILATATKNRKSGVAASAVPAALRRRSNSVDSGSVADTTAARKFSLSHRKKKVEPLLAPNPDRFVIFPIDHEAIWKMYKKA